MSDIVSPPVVAPPLPHAPVMGLPPLTLEEFRAAAGSIMRWVVIAANFTPTGFGIRTMVGGIQALIADDDAARLMLQFVNLYRSRGLSLKEAVAAIVAYVKEEFTYDPAPVPPKV